MTITNRLRALEYSLPAASAPAANDVSATRAGGTLFISGQIAQRDGRIRVGCLGAALPHGASVEFDAIVQPAVSP